MFALLLYTIAIFLVILAEQCSYRRTQQRQLWSMTCAELRAQCKAQKLTGYSRLPKAQLVALLHH